MPNSRVGNVVQLQTGLQFQAEGRQKAYRGAFEKLRINIPAGTHATVIAEQGDTLEVRLNVTVGPQLILKAPRCLFYLGDEK